MSKPPANRKPKGLAPPVGVELGSSSRLCEPQIDRDRPLVLVRWWDAYSTTGWRNTSEVMHESADNRTVGWLIRECDDYFVLAQTVGGQNADDPTVHTTYHIPRGMVREIVALTQKNDIRGVS